MTSMLSTHMDFSHTTTPPQWMFGADGYLTLTVASDYSNRVCGEHVLSAWVRDGDAFMQSQYVCAHLRRCRSLRPSCC